MGGYSFLTFCVLAIMVWSNVDLTPLLPEVSIYFVTLSILAFTLTKLNPSKPFMSLFATSVMAFGSATHFFSQSWDLSHESLIETWHDGVTTSLTLFTFAYMIADLPVLIIYGQMETYERIMYVIHHIVAAIQLYASIAFDRYQRLVLFFITAELTNILLNSRKIVPQQGLTKVITDALFAVSFLGYRVCYLLPILFRTVIILAQQGEWFELFFCNCGLLFIGILHIWWTYLILVGIKDAILPSK